MKTLVPQFILENFAQGQRHGHFQAASASVDISGFTPLTEMLFHHRQDGAEILGETLGTIFDPLSSAVYRAGGFIPLYAGDAFTAIFPKAENDTGETFQRTWQTANDIQRYLMPDGRPRTVQTPYGAISISAKIGLADGHVLKDGQDIIQNRARDIIDPAIRAAYLTQVPENLWLMEAEPPEPGGK